MNPLPLLLFALASKGGNSPFGSAQSMNFSSANTLPFDSLLNTLQHTVNTLEKVNQLSRTMSSTLNNPATVSTAPFSTPVAAEESFDVENQPAEFESQPMQQTPTPFGNIDLQNAIQTLSPILSMLNQNGKAQG